MTKTKWFISLAIVFLLAQALLACATPGVTPAPGAATAAPAPGAVTGTQPQHWNNTVAAARREGKVVVYAGALAANLRESLSRAVQERYGVSVEFVTGRGTEVAQKLIFERRSNIFLADLTLMGPDSSLTLKANGVFTPMAPSLILPEVTEPKSWPGGALPYFDKDQLMAPLTVGYQSYIVVNSDLVKEGQLKSYGDFLDPQWKGKIILFDPSTGGGSGINWVTFMLKHAMGIEEGKKFFQRLLAQDLAVTRDGRLQVEGVARGKYAIAIAPTVSLVSEFIATGAPIKWTRLQEGGTLAPAASVVGLVEKPAHPNAAVVMVNWLLSAEGQRAFSREFGQPATRLGVSTEGIDPGRIPVPGEKAYLADEEFTVFSKDTSIKVAREMFAR